MGEIEFIFQVKEYDSDALLPQVSKALQRRLELRNQQVRPGKVDPSKMTEEQRKQAKIKNILWGVIWVAVGIYFLVSGFTKGENATLPLVIGVLAIFLGIKRLIPQRKQPHNTEKFDKAAKEFLDGHKENLGEEEHQVCFSDEEMIIVTGAIEDLDQEAVTYDEVEFAMETEDIFLLVHGGHGVMLQKKDITLGSVEEFRDYLAAHVKSFTPYEPEVVEGAEQAEVPAAAEEIQPEVIEEEVEVETTEEVEETEEIEEE